MSSIDGAGIRIFAQNSGWEAAENEITRLPDQELNKLLGYNPDPASREMSLPMRESVRGGFDGWQLLRSPGCF